VAQQEHEQAIVDDALGADHLAKLIVHILLGALDRAFKGDIFQERAGMVAGGIPGGGKGSGMGCALELVGGLPAHADRGGGKADLAGIGQRFDEAAHLLLGPAIVPGAAADGNPAIQSGIVGFGGRQALVTRGAGGGRGGGGAGIAGRGMLAHPGGWSASAGL
jgi:hypothetical protein